MFYYVDHMFFNEKYRLGCDCAYIDGAPFAVRFFTVVSHMPDPVLGRLAGVRDFNFQAER
jgi:hypothetical protein